MILALLFACGPGGRADVGGDWYGSFVHAGPDPWPFRLFNMRYEGPLDPESTSNAISGDWRSWRGTFELWGRLDASTDDPPTEDLVGEAWLWVCEDVIRCMNGADMYGPHGYLLTGSAGGGELYHTGMFDEAQLNPMWGGADWTYGDGYLDYHHGRVALAPAYAGLSLGDPP